MKIPTTRGPLIAAIATTLILLGAIASCSYSAGREAGRTEGPSLERKRQLEQLRQGIEQRDRAIRNRDARIAVQRDSIDAGKVAIAVARKEYSSARARVEIVDSSSAKIDGLLAQLPAPVIQVIGAGDALHRADSTQIVRLELQIVSLEEWGNLWKGQAEDYRIRGEILEEQLVDERRGRRRAIVKTALVSAATGFLGAVAALH